MTNQQELYDRINFWRNQNDEPLISYTTLSSLKQKTLESILEHQHSKFVCREV
jgi:hypothetical protein